MPEVGGVPGDNEVEPFHIRAGYRDIVLEIASRQRTRAKQGFFAYRRYL